MRRGVDPPTEFVWRFQVPERRFRGFPGGADPAVWARVLGLPEREYAALLETYADEVRTSVAALDADPSVAAAVDALPWRAGTTVVAFGDSITAERASWFEVVRGLLTARRGDEAPALVNAGVSGDGTAHALSRLDDDVVLQGPDVVLVAFGVNDARTHGADPIKCLTSVEEFAANLRQICRTILGETGAELVLLTPTPVIEELVARQPYGASVMYRNADIEARADVVREVAGESDAALVDTHAAFVAHAGAELYHDDGLHPAAAGQRLLARTVLRTLTTPARA